MVPSLQELAAIPIRHSERTPSVSWCKRLETRMVVTTYNHHVRLLSPGPLVGWHHQSLLGRGSRHCYGINYTQNPAGGRNGHPAIFLSFGLTSEPSMIHVLVPQLGASPERILVISGEGDGRKIIEILNVASSEYNLFRLQCCAH